MNWEPSMDPYELRESIGENLEETCQHGDKAFPCAGYRDHYRRGREGYPWHWHDEWEIAFVEQGQVRAQVNGEQHLLGPGEGIFINRRVLHAFSLEGNGEVWMPNLLFLPSLLYGSQESVFWEKYAKPLAFSTGCTHLVLRQDVPWQREALAQAGRAYGLLEEAAYGYELRVRSALSEVLVALAGHLPELPSQPSRNQAEIRRVRQMLTFIQGHYTQPFAGGGHCGQRVHQPPGVYAGLSKCAGHLPHPIRPPAAGAQGKGAFAGDRAEPGGNLRRLRLPRAKLLYQSLPGAHRHHPGEVPGGEVKSLGACHTFLGRGL